MGQASLCALQVQGRSALLIGPPCRAIWQGPRIWEEGATTTICCLSNQDGEVCDPKVEETWIFILDIKQHSGAHDMEAPEGSSDMQQASARPSCLLLILEETKASAGHARYTITGLEASAAVHCPHTLCRRFFSLEVFATWRRDCREVDGNIWMEEASH